MDDCVHWLDLGTGEVEFRPVESPWTPDPSNWRLCVRTDGTRSVFRKVSGDSTAPVDLIDIRSDTFKLVSRLLSALEYPEHIIITHTNHHALEASLSRLHLAFFVNRDSELECRSMSGYVIDKHQSCGTLFGLRNKLVLCPSCSSPEMPRRVVIPKGDIKFGLDHDEDFARITIKTGTERRVHWHEYIIDTDLGRLTGNVSLHSKLYQCYLHALTSHCLPDPLLGHTGTEEALIVLQSAASLSFQRLFKDDAMLLNFISHLTPGRVYYPPHRKSMVTVEWNNLPIFSQHHDFHPVVHSIFDHATVLEALYRKPLDKPIVFEVPPQDALLLKRAASRNKIYYPYDLQNLRLSSTSIPEDVAYKSRDASDGGSAELSAFQMSWSVWNGRLCLSQQQYNLWDAMQSWKSLGTADVTISLRYSRYWLSFNAAKDWIGIYDICQEALNHDPQDTKIRLAFSLSAASFARTNYANIIRLILILATDTRFRVLKRPSPSNYILSDGTYPETARLVELMSQFALALELTPAGTMEVRAVAHKKVAKERRREYNSSISEITSATAQSMVAWWPKRRFKLPHQWFDTQGCRERVDAYLDSISRNINLRDHIHRLEAIIYSHEITIPPDTPYLFSPRFGARLPRETSPSLRGVLMSRAVFAQSPILEQSDFTIPSTVTIETESKPPSSREDSLSSLIHEIRQFPEPLLRIYGEDLSKSHRDYLEKVAPFPIRRVVPQQEALRYYRDLCSKQKDAIFSQLSQALAPSQKRENVVSLSGLWPRITPRSVLRELSKDCVHTLTDQWKNAITRYAVAFLKYQQSKRLLDLSSRRRDDELLREADTTCEDVTAACSPDWLLIQVSQFTCGNFTKTH